MKIFINLNPEILTIAQAIAIKGGQALLVGGCVRDELMQVIHKIPKQKTKDIDIEVFGISQESLELILKNFGKVDLVGESFAVTKLTTSSYDYDFSLPRREVKSGEGHTGFKIVADPNMSIYEAASRRDVTVNAIYFNPLDNVIYDPFEGLNDISDKIIRHVSEKFADPLRVLRVMQFCGRFDFMVSNNTIVLCQNLLGEFKTLPKERIGEEFNKLLIKGIVATPAFKFMRDCYWTSKFTELHQIEVGQHWEESYDLCDNILIDNVKFQRNDFERLVLGLAGLCFYMNNPEAFLNQINAPNDIKKMVINLVNVGQEIVYIYDRPFDFDIIIETKKKLVKLTCCRVLFTIFMASFSNFCWTQQSEFLKINTCISDESITSRVTGDDLIKLGWTQGKELGIELKRLFYLQLEQNSSKEELLETVERKSNNDIYL